MVPLKMPRRVWLVARLLAHARGQMRNDPRQSLKVKGCRAFFLMRVLAQLQNLEGFIDFLYRVQVEVQNGNPSSEFVVR